MVEAKNDTLFSVGKVVGFHGLKGQLKVRPSTNNLPLLLDVQTVQICFPNGSQIAADVTDIRIQKQQLIITLRQYQDRNTAEPLLNAELMMDRQQLRQLDKEEWWISDLVGLDVFTTSGAHLGKVTSVFDQANQLLEISSSQEGKTILVPFVKDLVPLVDIQKRRIEVLDVPGLLEPQ